MNCLVVVNTLSGRYTNLSVQKVIHRYTNSSDTVTVRRLTLTRQQWSATGYDKVIVCGGDGTLYHALNTCNNTAVRHLVYVGCGTFNESCQCTNMRSQVGEVDGRQFSYVLACGTLTDIGYTTPYRAKKRLKILAYFGKILSSYKVCDHKVNIRYDSGIIQGNASLVMCLHSNRCFGLTFNRMYDKRDNKLYLLVVRSPGRDTIWNRLKLLFPLFRIFILGTNKAIHSNSIMFDSFTNAQINIDHPLDWCIDGEKVPMPSTLNISTRHPTYKLTIDKLNSTHI